MKKSSGSSRRAEPLAAKLRNIRVSSKKIGQKKVDQEIKALLPLRDEDIDTSDLPEITDWSKAIVGKFYRPRKEPITIRLDADVVAWLKAEGPGYQTRINTVLRNAMKPSIARTTRRTRRADSRS